MFLEILHNICGVWKDSMNAVSSLCEYEINLELTEAELCKVIGGEFSTIHQLLILLILPYVFLYHLCFSALSGVRLVNGDQSYGLFINDGDQRFWHILVSDILLVKRWNNHLSRSKIELTHYWVFHLSFLLTCQFVCLFACLYKWAY